MRPVEKWWKPQMPGRLPVMVVRGRPLGAEEASGPTVMERPRLWAALLGYLVAVPVVIGVGVALMVSVLKDDRGGWRFAALVFWGGLLLVAFITDRAGDSIGGGLGRRTGTAWAIFRLAYPCAVACVVWVAVSGLGWL